MANGTTSPISVAPLRGGRSGSIPGLPADSNAPTLGSGGTPSSAPAGGLTNLPPSKMDDLASQAVIDALNALTFGAGGPLASDFKRLAETLSQIATKGGGSQKPSNGFFSGSSESLFGLPVAKVDAPREGAVYKVGDRIFANRPDDSKVKAVFRVQLIVQIGMSAPLPVPIFSVSYPLGVFDLMVEAGFLYQLEDDKGFVYQMPVAPKIEAGLDVNVGKLGAEAVGGMAGEAPGAAAGGLIEGALSPFEPLVEIKGETTIEWTFVWVHSTDTMAFRALAVLMKIFNISPNQPFTIGLMSCEGNETGADLPVPFAGESQPVSPGRATPPTVPVSPAR